MKATMTLTEQEVRRAVEEYTVKHMATRFKAPPKATLHVHAKEFIATGSGDVVTATVEGEV